ncbi:ABC transporter ATP-binding protein [Bradyrhizobium sp. AS23.2]|uniref:ABC transporter ATP-binding protein n=1 Tax=Bradyrhizobium sp. AS23.2 TaxID=1680155 RepID=UPI00093E6380|nr:ABC transporter ATP-binding protein [Bradyrhizobium sp. AS23.2]OKO84553.1 amino acid ABC transporter ATP-binding protein [Bradyrhizobium sp. AS23.2]
MGAEQSEFVLEARGLTKSFAGFLAVNDVSLRVRRGSIHALIGPNGAGKTTVFNLLTKFHRPTKGDIFFEGRNITSLTPAEVASLGLVRSFQISAVFPSLTVLENVRFALQRQLGTSFYFWRSDRSLHCLHDQARQLIDAVNLTRWLDVPAGELPYGRKRALELATTLALEPRVMLLDEPMAGMGREDIQVIAALIKRLAENRTVLMVEHNLSVVASLSDCITVLRRGQILAEGPYSVVSQDPEVMEAYLGKGDESRD